ncbi:MAG: hypothetical protein EXX96DRAFT_547014 [Benjaminiella poitrasii]|nr:MAG: hypothetical protein EXX96DRAFT_547014 [Benjaminiella poitrasii]
MNPSRQHYGSNNNYHAINYDAIEEMKRNNKFISPHFLYRGIVEEAKIRRNFPNAESLFKDLEDFLNEKEKLHPNYVHSPRDVQTLQKSVATLVRYAPTPEQSLQYATYFFQSIQRPIRNAATELIVFTNLIYSYSIRGTQKSMEDALSILELVLSQGVFKIDRNLYNSTFASQQGSASTFRDSLTVFETVSKKVLAWFKLDFSEDRMSLVPANTSSRHFSH